MSDHSVHVDHLDDSEPWPSEAFEWFTIPDLLSLAREVSAELGRRHRTLIDIIAETDQRYEDA